MTKRNLNIGRNIKTRYYKEIHTEILKHSFGGSQLFTDSHSSCSMGNLTSHEGEDDCIFQVIHNEIMEDNHSTLQSGNTCYHLVKNLLSSSLLSKIIKIRIQRTVISSVVL
jgi:hypothetical protein